MGEEIFIEQNIETIKVLYDKVFCQAQKIVYVNQIILKFIKITTIKLTNVNLAALIVNLERSSPSLSILFIVIFLIIK